MIDIRPIAPAATFWNGLGFVLYGLTTGNVIGRRGGRKREPLPQGLSGKAMAHFPFVFDPVFISIPVQQLGDADL